MARQDSGEMNRNSREPYAVIGAGPLVSHLWRIGNQTSGVDYAFNILWMQDESGRVLQKYRPRHVRDLVKLCRVLTSVLLDDGWLNPSTRETLLELDRELAELTCCRGTEE